MVYVVSPSRNQVDEVPQTYMPVIQDSSAHAVIRFRSALSSLILSCEKGFFFSETRSARSFSARNNAACQPIDVEHRPTNR